MGHKITIETVLIGTALLTFAGAWPVNRPPRLKVFRQEEHPGDRRFLVTDDGKPFFYLGDTAWELFHRLSREDVDIFLENRASKGFTVIQAVVLAEFDGLNVPNPYGQLPLIDKDPTQPNEAYFQHVDYIVNRASELGLFIGMLPTWGKYVTSVWGEKQVVFNPSNARVYGEFLGRRYRGKPIIWILGGDRPASGVEDVWRAMAEGLRKGDEGEHLITYHPQGGNSSANWLHDEEWLDFNMIQSGHHRRNNRNYEMIATDYARVPVKPCMDSEPPYEDHPINWNPENGWFGDYDVRKAAYWALFAGAHGHTYGCHDIWQFLQPKFSPVSHGRTYWRVAMDLPGSFQVRYARALIESHPMLIRIPDQSILASDPGGEAEHVRATRGADGSYAFIYIPTGKPVSINMDKISGGKVKAFWYDPRNGKTITIGEFPNSGTQSFTPPSSGIGNDWVLVLDDGTKGFLIPGVGRTTND